ncbi:hypothetical protein KR222_010127, partial [Zaprionus bogoriensis]
QDPTERRVAELNRVYKEFISVWKKPKHPYAQGGKDYASKPVRLNALNDLMNVVENLRQPDTVDNIVKAINDGMMRDNEIITIPSFLGKGDVKVPLNNEEREHNSRIFKRVPAKTDSDKSAELNTGGLYEEYRRKLSEILSAHKNQRKSWAKQDKSTNVQPDQQCHCDEMRAPTLAVDSNGVKLSNSPVQCHCEASQHPIPIEGSAIKLANGPVACHCDSQKCVGVVNVGIVDPKLVANKVLFNTVTSSAAQKKCPVDKGPKPYYISNSKERQMVWNDIPLSAKKSVSNTQAQSSEHTNGAVTTGDKNKYPAGNVKSAPVNIKPKTDPPPKPIPVKNETLPVMSHKNQSQLQYLIKVLQSKHRSSTAKLTSKRGLSDMMAGNQPSFPQVLVNQLGPPQASAGGGKMIENMAKQLNVSPTEMAQRIASSSGTDTAPMLAPTLQSNLGDGFQVPNAPPAVNRIPPEATANLQTNQANLGPILEKILTRLQTIQDFNFNRDLEFWNAQSVPCCFAEPSDGAPCELTGSWESLLLGVRINIKDESKINPEGNKPICIRPRSRRASEGSTSSKRQCVKLTPAQIKERFKGGQTKILNVTMQDTLPPRSHEMMDNITEWVITGHAISTLGGPITFSCRKMDSKLMGTFVGFCRNCGCIDTIFGSWTFCHPSRDCQDITMSIFERRDIMRRYSLPDVRRERYKEQLFKKSKFAQIEKDRAKTER